MLYFVRILSMLTEDIQFLFLEKNDRNEIKNKALKTFYSE